MTSLSLDAEQLYSELRAGVGRLLTPQTVLVGIWSGGAWLAQRLNADLKTDRPVGTISSTLHRDDFGERGLGAVEAATELPFEIDGAHILLIDDVVASGRTIRAVVNELFDYGRPASVELAVLVDRGGRELPIHAAVSAARITLPSEQRLSLARDAAGRFSFDIKGPN
jgi:pyrimidine operon attenuation protein/uracil phosphoribosyltransferase